MKTTTALALTLGISALAGAQVGSINGVRNYREFTNDSDAGFTLASNYPTSIVHTETNVDGDGTPANGGANRDNWDFSANGGTTSLQFNNDDFFSVAMDVRIALPTGATNAPRKEAGFLFNTAGGQGQFIVNSDAGEVVVFGGPLPFYSFNSNNALSYTTGTTIRLGMRYFRDGDGLRKIVYSANGINSPALEFTNLEQGIITGSRLGGYSQVNVANTNPSNGSTSTFSNIAIGAPVPEPASMAALGLGALALLRRRRASK